MKTLGGGAAATGSAGRLACGEGEYGGGETSAVLVLLVYSGVVVGLLVVEAVLDEGGMTYRGKGV